MNIREEIYKRLGLQFGSLKSESGNDWVRAEKEILEEQKREEKHTNETIDYVLINKSNMFYKDIFLSDYKKLLTQKIEIAKRRDLIKSEIVFLFKSNDKDVILNLIRNNYLDENMKKDVLKNGTYLCKKALKEENANRQNPTNKKSF